MFSAGMRFRGILRIADYDRMQAGNFSMRNVKNVPKQEAFFPAEITFPFAEARKIATRSIGIGAAAA